MALQSHLRVQRAESPLGAAESGFHCAFGYGKDSCDVFDAHTLDDAEGQDVAVQRP